MWILGHCRDASHTALKIDLPQRAYLVPCSYDAGDLAALGRLLCDAAPKVRDLVVMTWKQADALEALGRVRSDGHRTEALWALHGDARAGRCRPAGPSERHTSRSGSPRCSRAPGARTRPGGAGLGPGMAGSAREDAARELARADAGRRAPPAARRRGGPDRRVRIAAMTSDPIEMLEILEKTVEHRLTYVFPAGIPLDTVVSGPVNVEAVDGRVKRRVAAAHRLARRVNRIATELRGDAVRVLAGWR